MQIRVKKLILGDTSEIRTNTLDCAVKEAIYLLTIILEFPSRLAFPIPSQENSANQQPLNWDTATAFKIYPHSLIFQHSCTNLIEKLLHNLIA